MSTQGRPNRKQPIADSWEDEDDSEEVLAVEESSGSNLDQITAGSMMFQSQGQNLGTPTALKPTPLSPRQPPSPPPNTRAANSPAPQARTTRPESVSGPASRMIASALGVRAPPRTAEQRAYDKAVKEKEIRRKTEEKEKVQREAEERERAKRDIWDS